MSLPHIPHYELPTEPEIAAAAMSAPPALPWQLDPAGCALLVHDAQEHFFDALDRNSALYERVCHNILRLRLRCDALGVPVIYSFQPPEQSASDRGLLQDRWGAGITRNQARAGFEPTLTPTGQHRMLAKCQYSAFQGTALSGLLTRLGRRQLIVCGVYAHIGCLLTSADAFMRGIQPFYVADAMADFDRARHLAAARYVAELCGVACLTDQALSQLDPREPALAAAAPSLLRELMQPLVDRPLDALPPDSSLAEVGLDSLRLMTLVEALRGRGVGLAFAELAGCDSWGELQELVRDASAAQPRRDEA